MNVVGGVKYFLKIAQNSLANDCAIFFRILESKYDPKLALLGLPWENMLKLLTYLLAGEVLLFFQRLVRSFGHFLYENSHEVIPLYFFSLVLGYAAKKLSNRSEHLISKFLGLKMFFIKICKNNNFYAKKWREVKARARIIWRRFPSQNTGILSGTEKVKTLLSSLTHKGRRNTTIPME